MELQFNLDTIILYVQDVESLRSFYVDFFKLEVVEEYQSEWVLLKAGNCQIGLHQIGERYRDKNNARFKFHNNTKMVFEINDDISKARAQLLHQKVAMREIKTFDNYDYWLCDGEDPEGNVFQLKQKKL